MAEKENSYSMLGGFFLGTFTLGIGLPILFAVMVYFLWAGSYVALTGYNWFLLEVFKVNLTQIHFVAAMILGLLFRDKTPKLKKDSGEPDGIWEVVGKTVAVFVGPWISLLGLYVLTFFK